jgi:hypothetical protein
MGVPRDVVLLSTRILVMLHVQPVSFKTLIYMEDPSSCAKTANKVEVVVVAVQVAVDVVVADVVVVVVEETGKHLGARMDANCSLEIFPLIPPGWSSRTISVSVETWSVSKLLRVLEEERRASELSGFLTRRMPLMRLKNWMELSFRGVSSKCASMKRLVK